MEPAFRNPDLSQQPGAVALRVAPGWKVLSSAARFGVAQTGRQCHRDRFCLWLHRARNALKLAPQSPGMQRQAAHGAYDEQSVEQAEDQMKNLQDRIDHCHGKAEDSLS